MNKTMLTRFLLVILMIVLSVNIVFGEQQSLGTFKRGENVNLVQNCFNCTYVNITSVTYPDSTFALVGDYPMSQTGTTYNYNFTSTSQLGQYIYCVIGDPDGQDILQCVDFEITPTGKKESNSPTGLAIAIFFIVINIGLFILVFGRKQFHENKYTNFVIKRSLLVIAIFFTMFNISIMASLVASTSYDLMNQMYGFMELVGWIGYASIIILFLTSFFQLMNEARADKKIKRTGGDEYD